MQLLCTPHYRYKSLQCCCGSKFGTEGSVTGGAKLAVFSELAVISEERDREERDNWKAPLSSIRSDVVHSEAIQPVLHIAVLHASVLRPSVLYTTVRRTGRALCLSDSNMSMNYLASSAVSSSAVSSSVVAAASVDYPGEFREKVGRTVSCPALH